jgi:hypothetical protein
MPKSNALPVRPPPTPTTHAHAHIPCASLFAHHCHHMPLQSAYINSKPNTAVGTPSYIAPEARPAAAFTAPCCNQPVPAASAAPLCQFFC